MIVSFKNLLHLISLGNWKNGIRYFRDISPADGEHIINSITVDTISAKWCHSNITLKFYLQEIFLGVLFIDKEECECFTCPYPYSFTKTLNTFDTYIYGGMNSLKVDTGMMFDKLNVKLIFRKWSFLCWKIKSYTHF
jgi:hypothetical protein